MPANADAHDMVAPSGEGAVRCMRLALESVEGGIDYLNPHGTSTPIGDAKEMEAVRAVFGEHIPLISSTKSLTGHSLGAAGAQEAIYCLLMMREGFVAESAHIDQVDEAFADMPIVRRCEAKQLDTVMSNSFGFGGTNGCLVLRRYDGVSVALTSLSPCGRGKGPRFAGKGEGSMCGRPEGRLQLSRRRDPSSSHAASRRGSLPPPQGERV